LKPTFPQVRFRITGDLPPVQADPIRVAQVFHNLATNAAKYTETENASVEIGTEEVPGGTVYYVRDNGIGIPERHQGSIFRIFKRLHGRSKFGGGIGAGLTIVKRVVEAHQGAIWLESEPGAGSTFYFTLGFVPHYRQVAEAVAAENDELADH
jgi:light-regulated signal transduction histidine kinase (bacteriophytochrome)